MTGGLPGVRISEAFAMQPPPAAEARVDALPAPAAPAPGGSASPDASSPGAIVRGLTGAPGLAALALAVQSAALAAAERGDASFGRGGTSLELGADEADTPYGNAKLVLERGVATSSEAALLGALVAIGVGNAPSTLGRAELARQLVWLAAHTPVDALLALDAALGERAGSLWSDLAELAADAGAPRVELLTAAAALRASRSKQAARAAHEARDRSADPLIRALLEGGEAARLSGEITPAPRGPVLTILLAITGLLLIVHAVRLLGRLALAYKRPAQVRLSERGLEVAHKTLLLGRVLRERETVVPMDNLARVTREVRYPRIGMYAGLLALVLGSYLGIGLLVDGARVPGGSPPLLGLGLLLLALGIGIDFALTTLSDSVRGRCRLIVEPKKGRRVCVAKLDPASADRMLAALAEHARP
jgi:hypothetical protein